MSNRLTLGRFGLCQILHQFTSALLILGALVFHTSAFGEELPDRTAGSVGPAEARRILQTSCASGVAESCAHLGLLLRTDAGGPADLVRARKLLEDSCGESLAGACVPLGEMLLKGEGGPRNPAAAREVFQVACAAEISIGCYNLAVVNRDSASKNDHERARELFAGICSGNDTTGEEQLVARACNNYGALLYRRPQGPEDAENARAAFNRACSFSHLSACATGAAMALRGEGGAQDSSEARNGFELACHLAAKQQQRSAGQICYSFANLLYLGVGGIEDRESAREAFRTSCKFGSAKACTKLAEMAQAGEGGQLDRDEAIESFRRATELYNVEMKRMCESGHRSACNALRAKAK